MKFILSPVYLVSLLALTHAADADDFSLRGDKENNYLSPCIPSGSEEFDKKYPCPSKETICLRKCIYHWKPFAAMLDNLGHTPETWCKLLCDQNADYDPTNPPGKTDVTES